jgi:hypothetical protein
LAACFQRPVPKLLLPAKIDSDFSLVVLWFVCPILPLFIYSLLFTPVFVARYTICAAPAFFLLIATALTRIDKIVPVYLSLLALMIVIVPGLQDYYAADVNEHGGRRLCMCRRTCSRTMWLYSRRMKVEFSGEFQLVLSRNIAGMQYQRAGE